MNDYHLIRDIKQDPSALFAYDTEIMVRGSYQDAEKRAKERNYKSYTIFKVKFENDKFIIER